MTAEKFARYQGRDVRVLKECRYTRFSSALIQSMGEPFYTEYAAKNDSTYGKHEYMIWVNPERLEDVRIEEIPADLPIPADPADDEPVEAYESMFQHVNDLRAGVA